MKISLSANNGLGCFNFEWKDSDSSKSGTKNYTATSGGLSLVAAVGKQSIHVTLKKGTAIIFSEGGNQLEANRSFTAQGGPTGNQYAIAFVCTGSEGTASGVFSVK